jgi:hypothetical protein
VQLIQLNILPDEPKNISEKQEEQFVSLQVPCTLLGQAGHCEVFN